MRVDDAPALLRPWIAVYGWAVAAAFASFFLVQRPTVRVAVEHAARLSPGANYIFCHWHEAITLLFQSSVPRFPPVLRGAPQAWMQHPLWYMKPIHLFLRGIGVNRIVLGSSGHAGRHAADELVGLLRAGYSTVVLPDGPAGPPRELKRGVLHMAGQSGVPIVPLRLRASRSYRVPTWDRKLHALPFSTIRVSIGEPIAVGPTGLDEAERRLVAALG